MLLDVTYKIIKIKNILIWHFYFTAGAEEDVSSGCSIEMEDVGEQRQVEPTWEDKVLRVLHIVRRNQFAEYDPKEGGIVYTRFCIHNIALFDLDKECEYTLFC